MLESALNKDNSTSENQLRYLAKKAEAERKKEEGYILASSEETIYSKKKAKNFKNEVFGLQDIYMQQLDE